MTSNNMNIRPAALVSYPLEKILHSAFFKTPGQLATYLVKICLHGHSPQSLDFLVVKCDRVWYKKIRKYFIKNKIHAKFEYYFSWGYLVFHVALPTHDAIVSLLSSRICLSLRAKFPGAHYEPCDTESYNTSNCDSICPDGSFISFDRFLRSLCFVPNMVIEVGNWRPNHSLGAKVWEWFKRTNEDGDHVSVAIIVKLIYGKRNNMIERNSELPYNNRSLVSVIYSLILNNDNPLSDPNTDIPVDPHPLNTDPSVDFKLAPHATVQIDLKLGADDHPVCSVHQGDGLDRDLSLPRESLLNGVIDQTESIILNEETLIKAAKTAYKCHERDFKKNSGRELEPQNDRTGAGELWFEL